ncbi:hypothetical protein LTR37_001745 [Vermiconidia calcicola]|uniref:Uncharacterized protein n=1 Tax=Vermiconidia calcicola TaxID=1690605 RepID=A0ACC3NXH3_9PEZI|nr:hypothetical protein LTR37_001745 [Vermiconidia calcicola]
MRSLDSARDAWQEFKQYQTLQDVKVAVRLDGSSSIATSGCRSVCWKAFLLFDTLDTTEWQRTLSSTRSAYNSLRAHFLRHLEDRDEWVAGQDPLSGESEASPWVQIRKDDELRGEILQDVVRCMPENEYFRQPDTQRMLTDILFIFCKLNPDVSYRQGMHELLAPILWVVERDAIDLGQSSKAMGEDAIVKAIFDAEHVEHDTFALFAQVMQSAKNFYEQTTTSGKENPMVSRSRRIFHDMLPLVDVQLAKHLEKIDVIPQIFLIRWVRLLFGREFAFDDLLTMWDVIFAEDTTLEMVDHICLAMLLRIRWDLIEADYNVALTLLLRYPEPGKELSPQTFALDAIYLREHMDRHCGSHLVSKYTGRPLQQAGRPVTPPALQRNITAYAGANAVKAASTNKSLSPSRSPRPGRNLEAVLQSTAKNLYAQSEKYGVGKAVRSAVSEVHRKAQEIREAQTPSSPVTWRQRGPPPATDAEALRRRLQAFEDRNRQLSKLLGAAVNELWEYQRVAMENSRDTKSDEDSAVVERLSMAVAKAQFVQVYLDDPALPLPAEPGGPEHKPGVDDVKADTEEAMASNQLQSEGDQDPSPLGPVEEEGQPSLEPTSLLRELPNNPVHGLADPSTFEDSLQSAPDPGSREQDKDIPDIAFQSDQNESQPETLPPERTNTPKGLTSRPRLEQSSFSWMLGEKDSSTGSFANASAFPPEHNRTKGFLFGDSSEDNKVSKERRGSRGQRTRANDTETQKDEEVFDLGSLRRSKGK